MAADFCKEEDNVFDILVATDMDVLYRRVKATLPRLKGLEYAGPSMLTAEEKAFYFLLGSELLPLDGVVVDAGCWLGSSSFYIGKGVETSKRIGKDFAVYSCDLFRWDKTHSLQVQGRPIILHAGDDFQFLTERFLNSLSVRVVVKKVDYSLSPADHMYHPGCEPIEALLVDAGKTPELLINILAGYLPHCVDQKSYVFFQDYRDYFCWFIPPIVNFLGEALEPVLYLKKGGAGFLVRDKATALRRLEGVRDMLTDSKQLIANFDQALQMIGRENYCTYNQVRANKIGLFLHLGRVTEAYVGPKETMAERIDSDTERELLEYIAVIDREWPTGEWDSAVQNIYRRVRHAVTGVKDLELSYKSIYSFKRRLLNPMYLKAFLKRLLQK